MTTLKKIDKVKINTWGYIINFIAFSIFLVALYHLFTKGILPFLGYTIYSLVLITPRVIYSKININNQLHPELLSRVEILILTAIILNSLGYLWLFDKNLYFFIEYDTFVHFLAPILFTLCLAIILMIYYYFKAIKIDKTKFVLKLALLTAIYTLFWEVFEYGFDQIFKTGLYGQEGQTMDTLYDVVADLLSIPVSSVIIYKYFNFLSSRFPKIEKFVKIQKYDFLKRIKK